MRLHTHDFAEVFWIERGSGIHLINGERRALRQGDLVLIRPDDVHTFCVPDDDHLTQVNVAFDRETLTFLTERYFGDGDSPWSGDAQPSSYRLAPMQVGHLGELASMLFGSPRTRLLLERFLLELLCVLEEARTESNGTDGGAQGLPGWLDEAIKQFSRNSDALSQGPMALASLAGRSREHVNRVIQRSTGQTLTELVNSIRIDRAATGLRMTDSPITEVAIDCGVGNLSHFYRLFRQRYGVTPREYRVFHQAAVRASVPLENVD